MPEEGYSFPFINRATLRRVKRRRATGTRSSNVNRPKKATGRRKGAGKRRT